MTDDKLRRVSIVHKYPSWILLDVRDDPNGTHMLVPVEVWEERESSCEWREDTDTDSWDTSCGQKWCFEYDGPEENGVNFCVYCGHPVKIRRALAEIEEVE